jgi:DNA-binding CsgD family transcriptional regulator
MAGSKKFDLVARSRRILQLERFIFLGISRQEMAERLGVNEKTVRRDLKHRLDQLMNEAERSTVSYRQAILLELGRTYAEVMKDMANARSNGQPTHPYANTRVDIIRVIARVTGAEEAIRVEHSGTVEHHVQLVPESELARMATLAREIEAEVV